MTSEILIYLALGGALAFWWGNRQQKTAEANVAAAYHSAELIGPALVPLAVPVPPLVSPLAPAPSLVPSGPLAASKPHPLSAPALVSNWVPWLSSEVLATELLARIELRHGTAAMLGLKKLLLDLQVGELQQQITANPAQE